MFDFLFKRSANKAKAAATPVPAQQQVENAKAKLEQAKQAALTQADTLAGDEAAAVEFILQCEFADARLKAAAHVHGKAALERVLQAMRNTDRRVAKVMQARLDALQQQAVREQKAQQCVEHAQRLAQDPQLLPNQVADLDRAWQAVGGTLAEPLRAAFDALRTTLAQRLAAQALLQRKVIDGLARLCKLQAQPDALPHVELVATVAQLEQEMAEYSTAPEAVALPKHLVPEFARTLQNVKQTLAALEQRYVAVEARQDALAQWEAAELSALSLDALKTAWRSFPALDDSEAATALEARYQALRQSIAELHKPRVTVVQEAKRKAAPEANQNDAQQLAETLERMEQALEQGLLQAAAECERQLKVLALTALRASPEQAARIARARDELGRLLGWARWGGNVSREELVKAAEELPAQQLAVKELAKKVGSLRERWKSLEASAGSAPRALWERFDAACNTAYAPAAAHFKQLAEERQQNLAKGQALIAEVVQFAAAATVAGSASADWKAIAQFCQRQQQAWQRLATIERKEKKRLDAEFAQALQVLLEPLAHQRQIEIGRREQLIHEVTALNPAERSTLDVLRALQERWQEQAKSLPLERHDEQALWQRFRSACDAVFATRKQTADAADDERRAHLTQKQALCAALEAAQQENEATIAKLVRDSQAAWRQIGHVPRALEQQIEERYHAAIDALQRRLESGKRLALRAQLDALRHKLQLCQQVESALAQQTAPDPVWSERWQALPSLAANLEPAVQARFDAALAALQSGDAAYAAKLENNRAALSQVLLRCEIVVGLESPPELVRERLQLQVEVLQSSLKAGQQPMTPEAQLLALCRLPALVDGKIAGRIEQVLQQMQA